MIVARAPLRISFIGGGTDTKEFIENNDFGCVLGTSIDRYVYVFVEDQPSFEKSKYKFTYRAVEEVENPSQFKHPVIREMLIDLGVTDSLNIATMANLPGRSGLGSSSAFTVSLYAALLSRSKKPLDLDKIANYAIHCERILAKESGGYQDQFHTTYGGLRFYEFRQNQTIVSEPLIKIKTERYLSDSILLVATLEKRNSGSHAKVFEKNLSLEENMKMAREMRDLCVQTFEQVRKMKSEIEILDLLILATQEGWQRKQKQIREVHPEVSKIVQIGERHGAQAAKLCGAGGSGFVLFLTRPELMGNLQSAFSADQVVRPRIENEGVSVFEI